MGVTRPPVRALLFVLACGIALIATAALGWTLFPSDSRYLRSRTIDLPIGQPFTLRDATRFSWDHAYVPSYGDAARPANFPSWLIPELTNNPDYKSFLDTQRNY